MSEQEKANAERCALLWILRHRVPRWIFDGCVMVSMLLACLPAAEASRSQYPPEVACIIGEAGNQGYEGMLAVAEGIRNRGSLKGVYGCKNAVVDREPEWVWKKAALAWKESKYSNTIFGADHWENIKAFGKPYWAASMIATVTIGDHTFYKEG